MIGSCSCGASICSTHGSCNIASGNEKGDVENLVKRCQRTYLTPVPEVTSIGTELAQRLREGCERDLLKVDDHQIPSRARLLEKERLAFVPLPSPVFPACREQSTHVSKQLRVRCDGNDYSAPTEQAHQPCVVRGFVARCATDRNVRWRGWICRAAMTESGETRQPAKS